MQQNKIKLSRVSIAIILALKLGIVTACMLHWYDKSEEDTDLMILQDYHNLYFKMESSDYYASPVISARNLLILNSVSKNLAECFKKISISDECAVIQDMNLNTSEKEAFEVAYNKALSETLVLIFRNKLYNTDKIITPVYESYRKNLKKKITESEFLKAEEIGKKIATTYYEKMMPKVYAQDYVQLFNDSLYTNNSCNLIKDSKTENWLNNSLRYTSIIGDDYYEDLTKFDYFKNISITESEKKREAAEVMTLAFPLSNENKWIAEFWSDDHPGVTFTPVTRWFSILNQIIEMDPIPFEKALECYYLLSLGLHETVVQTWNLKYKYMEERPSVYINRNISKHWQPLHPNPKFPSYPSGHAAFGACAYVILEQYFGVNHTFTDYSHEGQKAFMSEPRSYKSLRDMAIENANSRLYLGVHYRKDCEAGFKLGMTVAGKVLKYYHDSKTT